MTEGQKRAVVGVFAHVDAGKTTLSEAMLFRCGAVRTLGRVDHGDAHLDSHSIERQRGITVFSSTAVMQWGSLEIVLLDTPGHVDFSAETERALQVLDYAVLVVSGPDGVQSHTETLWKMLQRYDVPTIVFVNKMDLAYSTPEEVLNDLRSKLGDSCISFSSFDGRSLSDETARERIALCSEEAMECYLECGDIPLGLLQRMVMQRLVTPVFFGSALALDGVDQLLDGLDSLVDKGLVAWPQEFGGRVFKITHDDRGTRLTWLKVTGGSLKVRDSLSGQVRQDGRLQDWCQKISQIRVYSGTRFEAVDQVVAGQVCAVADLDYVLPGDGLGAERAEGLSPLLEPVLSYRVELNGVDVHAALANLRLLADEDPMLRVAWNEQLHEIRLQLMGAVQLEVLSQLVKERFGMPLGFGEGGVLYKETIVDSVEGIGHYEPLRHYAEAHVFLEPLELGAGLEFGSVCSEDDLDRNWQRLIATHLVEREHLGVLTGAPLTDVRMTIVAGRAHLKHTEGGDFRRSTYRAIRQGLMKLRAQGKCQLLEPWFAFTLTVPQDQAGRAMSDIQRMCGTFDSPTIDNYECVISGLVPVSEMQGYAVELAAFTHGKGRLTCLLDGYRPCHDAEEVIARVGYDPEADLDNTPDSVFCSHGAGYTVKWSDVDAAAHVNSAECIRTPWRPIDAAFFSTGA